MVPARWAVFVAIACGKADEQPQVEATPTQEQLGSSPPSESPPPMTTTGPVEPEIDPDPDIEEPITPALVKHTGPCVVRWSHGPVLRFEYGTDQVKVRLDEDRDGKPDACGTTWLEQAKAKRTEMDRGCDGSAESIVEPGKADPKSNAIGAHVTSVDGDDRTTTEVTLITIPSFGGLEPGYIIPVERKRVKLKVVDRLVRRAEVKPTVGGAGRPEIAVDFSYEQDRLVRVREQLASGQADDATTRKFDYRYDDKGNIVSVKYEITSGRTGRAVVDYACWQ